MSNLESHDELEALRLTLAARFAALEQAFDALDAQAEADIVQWRYALRSAHALQPDYFRREGLRRGVLVEDEPAEAAAFYAYGYDTQQRIVYHAFFDIFALPRTAHYYRYADGEVEMAAYGHNTHTDSYALDVVARLVLDADGRPHLYGEHLLLSDRVVQTLERCHYDADGRLHRIEQRIVSRGQHTQADLDRLWDDIMAQQRLTARLLGTEDLLEQSLAAADLPQFQAADHDHGMVQEYVYDGERLLRIVARIAGQNPGPERVLYWARQQETWLEPRFSAARESLTAYVLETLRQQALAETVYVLVLAFDLTADASLTAHLGYESHRRAWQAETAPPYRVYAHLLSTLAEVEGEGAVFVALPPPLPDGYTRFMHEMRADHQWDVIDALLTGIAQDLNRADWGGVLATTDDFIVVAGDFAALEDPHEALSESVPQDKLMLLRKRGWIVDDFS